MNRISPAASPPHTGNAGKPPNPRPQGLMLRLVLVGIAILLIVGIVALVLGGGMEQISGAGDPATPVDGQPIPTVPAEPAIGY